MYFKITSVNDNSVYNKPNCILDLESAYNGSVNNDRRQRHSSTGSDDFNVVSDDFNVASDNFNVVNNDLNVVTDDVTSVKNRLGRRVMKREEMHALVLTKMIVELDTFNKEDADMTSQVTSARSESTLDKVMHDLVLTKSVVSKWRRKTSRIMSAI